MACCLLNHPSFEPVMTRAGALERPLPIPAPDTVKEQQARASARATCRRNAHGRPIP